jgi:hypothetical protein
MSVTFSLFGYYVSFQLFKNLFVPIERLDVQSNANGVDELPETDYRQGTAQERKTLAS